MEKFQEYRELAERKLKLGDHILTQTYPMLKDPKLLLAVIDNLFLSMTYSIGSILYYAQLFKEIPNFQENYDSKINLFERKIISRYKIDRRYIKLANELKNIIISHKNSPMEFKRRDRLIICNENYEMLGISEKDIKKYIEEVKKFMLISGSITKKDEEIFKKSRGILR